MNKLILIIIFLFIFNSCSLDTKTGFWSKSEIVKSEVEPVEEKLFVNKKFMKKNLIQNLRLD